VIYHGVRSEPKPERVMISSSDGADFETVGSRSVPYEHVVFPTDRDAFIRLMLNDLDDSVMDRMKGFATSLGQLGLAVSMGRLVDFRARDHLRPSPENGTAPLIYPCHFQEGFVNWPAAPGKKPNAISFRAETRELMVPAGYYVLTKRFTSKEERRRVVAAIFDPRRIDAPFAGIENHLNYFHSRGKGLSPNLAKGLALYLNSTLFDKYFRLFSGHSQVNATDLRRMRYPTHEQLLRCGSHVGHRMPDQVTVDAVLERECLNNAQKGGCKAN